AGWIRRAVADPPGLGGRRRAWAAGDGHPSLHRQDVVRQPRRHRRRPLLPPPIGATLPQRPDRPAEVVTVQRQPPHRLVDPPVLGEAVRLPRLPPVAVAVRPVATL